MEENLDYLDQLFSLEMPDIRSYSSLTLAYIGDAIYELVIRTILVKRGNKQVNKLHKEAAGLVKAKAQSAMVIGLLPLLSPKEVGVYKRGRNAKSFTKAKNASVMEYRHATGFEALMGYLYLTGQSKRMMDLIYQGMPFVEEEKKDWHN
ncbi:MAG TPA: ribonuclease III domain-containing protein [Lachnospiraceae bacterium]